MGSRVRPSGSSRCQRCGGVCAQPRPLACPAAPENAMKFAGELFDPTSLYTCGHGSSILGTGRFTRADPAPTATEPYISSYLYAADRPTVLVDPSGMTFVPSDAAGAAVRSTASSLHFSAAAAPECWGRLTALCARVSRCPSDKGCGSHCCGQERDESCADFPQCSPSRCQDG